MATLKINQLKRCQRSFELDCPGFMDEQLVLMFNSGKAWIGVGNVYADNPKSKLGEGRLIGKVIDKSEGTTEEIWIKEE